MRKQSPTDNVQSVRKWAFVRTCTTLEGLRESNVILFTATPTGSRYTALSKALHEDVWGQGRLSLERKLVGPGSLDTSSKGKVCIGRESIPDLPDFNPRILGTLLIESLRVQYIRHSSLMGDKYNFLIWGKRIENVVWNFLSVEDLYCGILGFDTIQRGQWY